MHTTCALSVTSTLAFVGSMDTMARMTPIGYMSEVGMRVRQRRKALGVTQATVAQLAGVSRKAVSEIERGKPTIRVDVLTRVLEVVGLHWDVS